MRKSKSVKKIMA